MTLKIQFVDTSPAPEKYCGVRIAVLEDYLPMKRRILQGVRLLEMIEKSAEHEEKNGNLNSTWKELLEKSKEDSVK